VKLFELYVIVYHLVRTIQYIFVGKEEYNRFNSQLYNCSTACSLCILHRFQIHPKPSQHYTSSWWLPT